jgi:hypothetical protein
MKILTNLLLSLLALSMFVPLTATRVMAQDASQSAVAASQDDNTLILHTMQRDSPRPRRFTVEEIEAAGTGLPSWNGSFTHSGTTYKFVMVGTDPSKGSINTVVPVYLIPIKLTFQDTGTVFDASAPMIGLTQSAAQAVQASIIFQDTTYKAGTVTVGNTQYIDAFQRANFWSSVGTTSPNYHVILGQPTVLPVQALKVPKASGQTIPGPVAGTKRGILAQGFVDTNITAAMFKKFPQITPGAFTIFLVYNVFPGGNYGFHDVFGSSPLTGKTYTVTSYLEPYKQLIDADISTLAHEVGEWMDDPYVNNNTPCGTLLEVGDPLNTAIFSVKLGGMTWHPQDLAMLGYFSFNGTQSVNHWLTFRNTIKKSCG